MCEYFQSSHSNQCVCVQAQKIALLSIQTLVEVYARIACCGSTDCPASVHLKFAPQRSVCDEEWLNTFRLKTNSNSANRAIRQHTLKTTHWVWMCIMCQCVTFKSIPANGFGFNLTKSTHTPHHHDPIQFGFGL